MSNTEGHHTDTCQTLKTEVPSVLPVYLHLDASGTPILGHSQTPYRHLQDMSGVPNNIVGSS